jgi:hypothetical protein
VEGQNLVVERRYSEGKAANLFTSLESRGRRSPVSQCGSDRLGEFVHAEGLHEERPPGLFKLGEPIARHEHGLQPGAKCAQTLGKLAAVHQGHDDVHQEQIDITRPILAHSDSFAGINGRQDDIPQGFKGPSHPWANSRVIVDN